MILGCFREILHDLLAWGFILVNNCPKYFISIMKLYVLDFDNFS